MALHPRLHGPGPELRAFVLFYGLTLLGMLVLQVMIAAVVPAPLLQEYSLQSWTASFLVSSCLWAWLLERHRRRHAH
jgi:hypothetical protein